MARFDFCFKLKVDSRFRVLKSDAEAQDYEGVQRAHPAIIFTKGDIERPVQGIFNAPVLTNGSGNSGTL